MRRWIGAGVAVLMVAGIGIYFLTIRNAGQASSTPLTLPHTLETTPAPADNGIPVPPLPFEDNPDPLACGIPINWTGNSQGWLTGYYEGELVEPDVYLYDSHLRKQVTGIAPSGTEVRVLLYQQNPSLNYYMVQFPGADGHTIEGWVPAPFLSFDPPSA